MASTLSVVARYGISVRCAQAFANFLSFSVAHKMGRKKVRPAKEATSAEQRMPPSDQSYHDGMGWSAETNSQDQVQPISIRTHRPTQPNNTYQTSHFYGNRANFSRYHGVLLSTDPHAQFPTFAGHQPRTMMNQTPSAAAQVSSLYHVPAHAFFTPIHRPYGLLAPIHHPQHDGTPSTNGVSLRSRSVPNHIIAQYGSRLPYARALVNVHFRHCYHTTQHIDGEQRQTTPATDDPAVRPLTDNEGWARNYALSGKKSNPRMKKAFRGWNQPVPTQAYLARATAEPTLLPKPKQLLVILDLNGVLVHRNKRSKTGHKERPDMGVLLDYLFANHHVMVWSSGMPENITAICDKIFTPEQRKALLDIWGRDTLHLPPAIYKEKVQVYKQLTWVWDQGIKSKASAIGLAAHEEPSPLFDQSNTVLIDDSVEKAASEPHNLIEVDEFEAQPHEMQGTVLTQVVEYLEKVRWAADVSAWMCKQPFTFSK